MMTRWSLLPVAATLAALLGPLAFFANGQTAVILNSVPPRAPTSSTTFKNGVVIAIIGTATGPAFQNFQVDWASGLDPGSGWQTAGVTLTGGGLLPITNGPLANWDTSSISGAGYYTIRLTENDSNASSQALTMVYFQPDLLSANWPQFLDEGAYFSAGAVPAANADGTMRLVVEGPAPPGSDQGAFFTLTQNGAPQQTQLSGFGSFQQPSVADLDGSPGEEAVVPDEFDVAVFREDNTSFLLTSTTTLDYTRTQTLIEDLAGDSHWEALALGSDYNSQLAYVSAWRADGSLLNNNFPIQIADQNPVATWYNRTRLLVGGINGDGKNEIVVQEGLSPTTFTLRLFANDGSPLVWSVPVLSGIPEAMAAADLNHNGMLETILVSYSGGQAILDVFQPDGTERTGWPVALPNPDQNSQSFLAVGDLNQDGHDEIVYSHQAYLYVFNSDGTNFSSTWPLLAGPSSNSGYGSVVIGDVDGDGFPEIVTTLNTIASTPDPFFAYGGRYYDEQLLAIRRDGTISESWQLTGGNGYDLYDYPAPAIGDFNQDGITDIAVAYEVTGPGGLVPGFVTIVSTGAIFNPSINDWPLVHQNARNTNVLQSASSYISSTITTLTSSANPSVLGQSLTFVAAVTPLSFGANAPTGQISFLDGSANIGSCTLAAGNCTLTSSSLAIGTHSITAQYAGDAFSTVSNSPDLSQVVNAPDFSLVASGPQTVNAGSPALYTVTVAPNPSPYNFAVTNFSCSGLPTGAACGFKPTSVTPGGGSVPTALTITTTSRVQAAARLSSELRPASWLRIVMLVLAVVGLAAMPNRFRRQRADLWLAFMLSAFMLAAACGGGSQGNESNPDGTPAGSYTVTVSATGNANASHSTTVTLNVN